MIAKLYVPFVVENEMDEDLPVLAQKAMGRR